MMIKLSQACLASVGAKTADEFPEKLVALLNSCATLTEAVATLKTNFTTAQTAATEAKAALDQSVKTIGEQASKITILETAIGNPATLTEVKIKEIAAATAKTEASKIAVEQIGSIGGAPATAAPVNVPAAKADSKNFPDLVAAAIAAGKSKADAVLATIKSNPEAHAEWLKQGGTL